MKPATLVFGALALVTAGAFAQSGDAERHRLASQSFQQAQAAFGRRDFAAAAAAFEQAARFEPHPSPLLNAEEAWELAGELVHAAEDCDQVLALPDPSAKFHPEAESRLAKITPRIATLDVKGPASVRVRADGGTDASAPVVRRLSVGRHIVAWTDTRTARSGNLTLDLAAGDVRRLDVPPEPLATPSAPSTSPSAAPPERPAEAHHGVPVSAWIAFGAAGAATGVVAVFGGLTVAAQNDFNAQPTREHADAFNRDKLVTNVAVGVAAGSLALGVVLWAFSGGSRSRSALRAATGTRARTPQSAVVPKR